jgi:hypothetical protein
VRSELAEAPHKLCSYPEEIESRVGQRSRWFFTQISSFHQTTAATQNHYIKTTSPDAIAAMKQFSEALLCSTCTPDGDVKAKGSVQ